MSVPLVNMLEAVRALSTAEPPGRRVVAAVPTNAVALEAVDDVAFLFAGPDAHVYRAQGRCHLSWPNGSDLLFVSVQSTHALRGLIVDALVLHSSLTLDKVPSDWLPAFLTARPLT